MAPLLQGRIVTSVRPIDGGWVADHFMATSHPRADPRPGIPADLLIEDDEDPKVAQARLAQALDAIELPT